MTDPDNQTGTPLDDLRFPVRCDYPDCGEVFKNAREVDEHITEGHLQEAVWTFAEDHMRPIGEKQGAGNKEK